MSGRASPPAAPSGPPASRGPRSAPRPRSCSSFSAVSAAGRRSCRCRGRRSRPAVVAPDGLPQDHPASRGRHRRRRSGCTKGSTVEAGDMLVVLDDTRTRAEYARREARLGGDAGRGGPARRRAGRRRRAPCSRPNCWPGGGGSGGAPRCSTPSAPASPPGVRHWPTRSPCATARSRRRRRPRRLRGLAWQHRPADRADRRGDGDGKDLVQKGPRAQAAGCSRCSGRAPTWMASGTHAWPTRRERVS